MINIEFKDEKAIISGEDINPAVVFDCGQCFRFEAAENGIFSGIAHGREIFAESRDGVFTIWPTNPEEFESIWRNFFDLDYDYNEINKSFFADPILGKAAELSKGMRLLRQEPFETLISFIISANNNIKRIKKIIAHICRETGDEIAPGLYAFPTPEQLSRLSLEELYACGLGYRAPYIYETTRDILNGFSLEVLFELSYPEAKKRLCSLKGVGPKVADCILLFSFGKREAFPKDVWMKRILKAIYSFEPKNDAELTAFASEKFPEFAGLAQQYLFQYARIEKIV